MIYIDLSSRLYKRCWLLVSIGLACPPLITERIRDLFMYSSYMRTYVSKGFTEEF